MWNDNKGEHGSLDVSATCENDDGWFISIASTDGSIDLFTEYIDTAVELRDALTRAIDKYREVTA